ncbi:MAG: 4Fe-4S binding protein [Phycisphaerales bacterium]|nr:4Fe-4S binding protein [Phycisphaerales bacterium]
MSDKDDQNGNMGNGQWGMGNGGEKSRRRSRSGEKEEKSGSPHPGPLPSEWEREEDKNTGGTPVPRGDGGEGEEERVKEGVGEDVSLRVIKTKAPKMGATKTARWRTGVLVMVNVLMVVHLVQWLIMGVTVSPIEPSEAMETLEMGVVNAGAILFLVALLATMFFGRFFCGWLCHMVALQDFCAVLMSRIGVRPRAFRSRLLMWVPVILGSYMFVWPTFKRLALKPFLEGQGIDWPVWLRPVGKFYQMSEELIVTDYWATMPTWPVAIVFLIVCGFVTVYFLGAKGFCTYACPYAGFFKPLDKIAPVRVVVNDDCQQCGYCTAVCTSNVRVNEEVRDFGAVIDSGCMKTMDCVSACPNDALSIGFGGPAVLRKAKTAEIGAAHKAKRARRYDLSFGEDVVAVLVFAWAFYATRGLFDMVPMLMAGGLAAVVTMLVVQVWWMVRKENVSMHSLQLKKNGKVRFAGAVVGLLMVVMLGGSVWSGHAKYARWRGDLGFASFDVPSNAMMRRDFMGSPEMQARAKEAIGWYKRGDSFDRGGYGWGLHAEHRVRIAYLEAVMGDPKAGLESLRDVIAHGNPTDSLIIQAGKLAELSSGDVGELLGIYKEGLDAHPDLHLIRSELAKAAWSRGNHDEAVAMFDYVPEDNEIGFVMAEAAFNGFMGDMQAVQRLYEEAVAMVPSLEGNKAGWYIDIARGASAFGMRDLMEEMATTAIESPDATALTWLSAGELANALRQIQVSAERGEIALTMAGGYRSEVLRRAAGIFADDGQVDRSLELLELAEERAENDFDRKYIIELMVRVGLMLRHEDALTMGFAHYKELAERRVDVPVFMVDYAALLFNGGRPEEGVAAMIEAAELDERNAMIAQKVGEMYSAMGNFEKMQEWVDEADRRARLLGEIVGP